MGWVNYLVILARFAQASPLCDGEFIAAGGCREQSLRIIPTDTRQILPIRATHRQPDILLTPHSPGAKYERYRDVWQLLKR